MGMLGDIKTGLSVGQFKSQGGSTDPLERHAPLSRYGTTHPVDKALWKYDRVKEVAGKVKKPMSRAKHAESVLVGAVSAQKGAK